MKPGEYLELMQGTVDLPAKVSGTMRELAKGLMEAIEAELKKPKARRNPRLIQTLQNSVRLGWELLENHAILASMQDRIARSQQDATQARMDLQDFKMTFLLMRNRMERMKQDYLQGTLDVWTKRRPRCPGWYWIRNWRPEEHATPIGTMGGAVLAMVRFQYTDDDDGPAECEDDGPPAMILNLMMDLRDYEIDRMPADTEFAGPLRDP